LCPHNTAAATGNATENLFVESIEYMEFIGFVEFVEFIEFAEFSEAETMRWVETH